MMYLPVDALILNEVIEARLEYVQSHTWFVILFLKWRYVIDTGFLNYKNDDILELDKSAIQIDLINTNYNFSILETESVTYHNTCSHV